MKLKPLLEGYAWERKPSKGLPTLAEVEAQHRKNLTEEDDLTKQSLSTLSTVCEKCKSDLEAAFNQTEIGNADAKNMMQTNAMVLMNAICTYIADIQSLHEQNPEISMDDIVIENAKKILSDDILTNLEY
jgi:hypothetical protein